MNIPHVPPQPGFRQLVHRLILAFVVILCGSTIAWSGRAEGAAALPPGFEDEFVAAVPWVTAMDFTPDGRMLASSQSGKLRVYADETLLTTPAIDLTARLCNNGERGLLGIAVDPAFTTNNYIYLYYTYKKYDVCTRNDATAPVNRVSRFVLPATNIIDPGTEHILIDNIPSPAGIHNSGDLHFGKDGYLYISVGDGGCHYAHPTDCSIFSHVAQELNSVNGKILRITKTGDIPATNPFVGSTSARCNMTGSTTAEYCQEIFAYGLRNPFRMAFDPNATSTRFRINDVGHEYWEEINEGTAGANYGWSVREGACVRNSGNNCGGTPTGMTDPVYAYDHTKGCEAITGGAFVPRGLWPSAYDDAYLFGDFVCGKVFLLPGNGDAPTEFIANTGTSSITSMQFGPSGDTQALYYTSYHVIGSGSSIHRVKYTGAVNRPPTANILTNKTAGQAPLTVAFDGTTSSDPDDDTLQYRWDFGDGSAGATTATASYTYRTPGRVTATLTVTDPAGLSASATTTIDVGNNAPVPVITMPTTDQRFAVGQVITLQGQATDAEDGRLPKTQMTWTVLLHHDTHTHPYLQPTVGNKITFTAPQPEGLEAARTSFLEIRLTATDQHGVSSTTVQQLLPKMVDVTFTTVPAGLDLMVNGLRIRTPQVVRSWEGYSLHAGHVAQVDAADRWMLLDRWDNGSTATQRLVVTPVAPTTFTAQYRAATTPGLLGIFYDNQDFTGATRAIWSQRIDYDWGTGIPLSGIREDTFSVRWDGRIQPLYTEPYTFSLASDEGARLWIDDQLIIDHWTPHALAERSGTITLVASRKYVMRLEYFDRSGKAAVKLYWASAKQPREIVPRQRLFPAVSELTGTYYADESMKTPVMTRIDPSTNVHWGSGSPLVGEAARPFAVSWTGTLHPEYRETYTLSTISEGAVRVWIDGRLVIDNWTEHGLTENRGTVDLSTKSSYSIRVDYLDRADKARVMLSWQSTRQPKATITSRSLEPFAAAP